MKFETVFDDCKLFFPTPKSGWMYTDVHQCTPMYTGRNTGFSILARQRVGGGGATAVRIADGDASPNPTACAIGADLLVLLWRRIDFAIPVYGGGYRRTLAYTGVPRTRRPNPAAIGVNPAGGDRGTGWDYGGRPNPEFPRVGGINCCSRHVFCRLENRNTAAYIGVHWRTSAYIHRAVNGIPKNPLQRLDSGGMPILNYASKIPEINDSDP